MEVLYAPNRANEEVDGHFADITSQIIGNIGVGEFTAAEYEEMSDVAERISAPMDHSIEFMNIGGRLYTETSVDGKDLLTISREAELVALEMAKLNPQWAVEAYRRHIETEEIKYVTEMPDGASAIVFSPTPDVVLSGAVNIGGYNLDKKDIMTREWKKIGDKLTCRYISLSGGNREALVEAVRSIGRDIPDHYGSEEILATFYTFLNGEDGLADKAVESYDHSMSAQYGGDWSYGRPYISNETAMEVAMAYPECLDDFMAEKAEIEALYHGDELKSKLEAARYNYAAALDKKHRGEEVISNKQAGDAARASGSDYSGYCATGADNSQSNAEALESMFGSRHVTGKCPCCGETTTYDPCNPKCGECGSTPGNDRSAQYHAKKRELKQKQTAEQYKKGRESMPQDEKGKELGRKVMEMVGRFVWGPGAFSPVEKAIDYHGQVIAEGKEAQDMYRIYYGLAG